MSELEREEATGEVPREVQAGIQERRGGGASLDAGVRERLAPGLGDPLADVRIHTDTSAGTLARAVSARAFATGSDLFFAHGEYRPGTTDGDRLLAHELAHVVQQRGAPTSGVMRLSEPGDPWELEADAMAGAALAPRAAPTVARATGEALVARDFIDDIKGWFGSGEQEAKRVEVERKEVPVTKQDFDQILALVSAPLNVALAQLAGEPDVAKAKLAVGKLESAAQAVSVIAQTKKEPQNRDNLHRPLMDIVGAKTILEVMAAPEKAKDLWKEKFRRAMERVDEVLALPIRDENQAPDPAQGQGGGQAQPAANPDDSLTQRDHDLVQVSIKAPLERLIETASGEPYTDFDPKVVGADFSIPFATRGFSNRKLIAVASLTNVGLMAISAFALSMDEQAKQAVAEIERAQTSLAQAMASYGSDPNDPNSPGNQPPAEAPPAGSPPEPGPAPAAPAPAPAQP